MQRFESQSGYFAHTLYEEMAKNKDIWCLCADIGHGVLDDIRDDFPDRFVNTGAAEQTMLDMGVGLAMSGKIPICYTITSFLLFRGFETIRNYINHENIPVILVGRGRDKDYLTAGFSHWAEEDKWIMEHFMNIKCYWPQTKQQASENLLEILNLKKPCYLSLKRS